MTQLAGRIGSLSQRSALCHRGHHEAMPVLRWTYGDLSPCMQIMLVPYWRMMGNKCKHCGRWV
jgi:hypothetical protein